MSYRMQFREIRTNDKKWVKRILTDAWASTRVVSRGIMYQADELPGIIAIRGEEKIGLLTFNIVDSAFEIVTLNILRKREGIGFALVQEAERVARSRSCSRIWAITTNDNSEALKFYQAIGFQTIAIHRDAIKKSRELKPEIPLVNIHGIPITDEIELEKVIQ